MARQSTAEHDKAWRISEEQTLYVRVDWLRREGTSSPREDDASRVKSSLTGTERSYPPMTVVVTVP